MINKHKSNKIKENSNTVRHWNNGTDHRHSQSCCDKSSPARRTITSHSKRGMSLLISALDTSFWCPWCPSLHTTIYTDASPGLHGRPHATETLSVYWPFCAGNLLVNSLLWLTTKKALEPRNAGLCDGNPPVSGGFPSQRVSNSKMVSMPWRHNSLKKPK